MYFDDSVPIVFFAWIFLIEKILRIQQGPAQMAPAYEFSYDAWFGINSSSLVHPNTYLHLWLLSHCWLML